jgi:uncharacterized protein YbcI
VTNSGNVAVSIRKNNFTTNTAKHLKLIKRTKRNLDSKITKQTQDNINKYLNKNVLNNN